MRARDCAAVLAAIALLAAACGGRGGGASAGGTPTAAGQQPYLAYSRCMRTHGAPFWPDPSSGGAGPEYTITPRILAQERGPSWNAALSACAKQAPPQLPFTEAQLAAARSRLVAVTHCMRTHGFPGWPDPVVSAGDIGFLPPRGVNLRDPSPQLQSAEQACHWPAQ